jgi:hypothetical protein
LERNNLERRIFILNTVRLEMPARHSNEDTKEAVVYRR